ncbi:MAG: plastocyanin/azurin family copper-binding protein [Gammaproteobacteria bacterium]
MNKKLFLGFAALVAVFSTNVSAEDFTVKASGLSFKSEHHIKKTAVLVIQPGDTVTWVNLNVGGHDTASMEDYMPEGAEPWQSSGGEASLTVAFEKEGVYVYKCTPHVSQGMAAGIIVGNIDDYKDGVEIQKLYDTESADSSAAKRVLRKLAKAIDVKIKK